MTREEILNQFNIVAVRRPVKGELILATKNHGGECEVVEVSADFKNVVVPILEPKKICIVDATGFVAFEFCSMEEFEECFPNGITESGWKLEKNRQTA